MMFMLVTLFFAGPICALQSFDSWSHERIQLSDTSILFRYSASGKPPLLLIHGFPQPSRTWQHIGPILAESYTVIAPDNRGQGESDLATSDNYTAPAAAEDVRAILDFLNINKTSIVAHDKGGGIGTSFALEHPDRVDKLAVIEYLLPGFGYQPAVRSPRAYMDWQLAFFAVPDAAQYFIQGREKQMLEWYFFHGSYSGNAAISNDDVETYTRAISKPGFLRSGFQYFATVFWESQYFPGRVNATGKSKVPTLSLGGEASEAPADAIRALWSPVFENLTVDVVPKAGHWVPDENPTWTANRLLKFLASNSSVPVVDLSWLENRITMFGNLGTDEVTIGTNRTGLPF